MRTGGSGQRHGPRDLAGLRAVITGGSSGIGAATARAFAARGSQVAIAGRNLPALKRVAADTNGVRLPGDLCEPGCAQRTIDAAVRALGGLDVLVSNAGIGWAGPFASMSEPDIDSLLDVNLRAAAHLAQRSDTAPAARSRPSALRRIRRRTSRSSGRGVVLGHQGRPGLPGGCPSRGTAACRCRSDAGQPRCRRYRVLRAA